MPPETSGAGPIRLLALDLDGTVLKKDRHPHPASAAAIRAASEAGIVIAYASGRSSASIARVAEEIEAWVRAGIARWDGAELVIDRDTLDRLEAGLRVVPLRDRALDARSGAALPPHLEELAAWVSIAWPVADAEVLSAAMGAPRCSGRGR